MHSSYTPTLPWYLPITYSPHDPVCTLQRYCALRFSHRVPRNLQTGMLDVSTRYCGSKDASTGLCTGCADDCGGIWDHWKSEVSALGGIWYVVEMRELRYALFIVDGGFVRCRTCLRFCALPVQDGSHLSLSQNRNRQTNPGGAVEITDELVF